MTSIAAIVPTYKRSEDLSRCISSLILAASSVNDLSLSIFICNNDPSRHYSEKDFANNLDYVQLNIKNRPQNIGGRANFYFSLLEAYDSTECDHYVFISDDDYVFPDFFKSLILTLESGYDALICSCSVIYEPNLSQKGYLLTRSHTYRYVPTRPYVNRKLQFLIDSRLMTGTLYSRSLLSRFFDYAKSSNKNEQFICSLWYPMCFIASFSRLPGFIENPLFVHAQANEVFWGDIDYFNEFFLARLDMYSVMLDQGNITLTEFKSLITDFLGHQNFRRLAFYVFRPSSTPCSLRVRAFLKYVLINLSYRPAYLISAIARRLPGLSRYLLRI